jgi:hypothetical protein
MHEGDFFQPAETMIAGSQTTAIAAVTSRARAHAPNAGRQTSNHIPEHAKLLLDLVGGFLAIFFLVLWWFSPG